MPKVTIEQIREAYLAKDARKCADLLYDYIEQNPDIKQQIIEKTVERNIAGLVDYRKVDLGDSIRFTTAIKEED